MMRKHITFAMVILMALPGVLAALPATDGLPTGPLGDAALLRSEIGAGAPGSVHSKLYLTVQTFDPVYDAIDLPLDLRTQTFDGLFLVQFIGSTLPSWRERVEALGGEFVSYIPDNGFIVRLTRDARRDVVDLPFVRWVGPYHPGFRVLPEVWQDRSPVLGISVATVDDPVATAQELLKRGGLLEALGTVVVQGYIPRPSLLALARSEHVTWIEDIIEPEFFNDHSARLIGARQTTDGPYDNTTGSSRRHWSWDPVAGTFNGTTGKGYVVSLADTGLDDDHPSHVGHLPTINYNGGSITQDTYGHGTHCAGTSAGTGVGYPADGLEVGKYIGVAPEAIVFMGDIFDGFNFYRGFDTLGKDASERGAVSNSNSWGEQRGGVYGNSEVTYDTMVRDAEPGKAGKQPITFCFSAGNSGGGGDRTMASPASSKNVITVGATGNDKRGISSASVAGFSSRGPCADGRIKPDVVASGQHVVSAQAWPHTMPFDPPADGGQSWTFASGTSMSCPAVAGAVAVVHDWSENEWGHTPSPAMVKALMISGADVLRVDATYPGTRAGWGRVNLTKLFETPNYRTFFYDEDLPLQVGGKEHQRYIFASEPGERTIKFTLVWSDYPGASGASKALVSDLDMVVIGPDGSVYKGNNFNNLGHSLPGADNSNDTVNNVEKVSVPSAKEGFWAVDIFARNTPQGAQRFTLTAQGDLRDQWQDLVAVNVSINKEEVDEGDHVQYSGEILALGTEAFGAFDYEVYIIEKGTGDRTVFESGTIPSMKHGDSRSFSHTWTAVRGDWDFAIDIDTAGTITEFTKVNNEHRIGLFVKGYGLIAELIPPHVTVWPGVESLLEVNVLNTGNVPDTYSLSTEGIPVGWDVELDKEAIMLGVERTGTITMHVTPPSAAKAQELYEMHVSITSQGNMTYSEVLGHEAAVGQVHGIATQLSDEQRSVYPGLKVVHAVNITNTGNGDDTYSLSVEGVPPDWTATFSDDSITIEDNVTKVVRLEMQTPVEELMNTIARLDITVTSSAGRSTTLRASTRVRQSTGLDAELTAEEAVLPGERATFGIVVHNLGNGPDVFSYTQIPPKGWSSSLQMKEIVLDAYETFTGQGTLMVPKNARAGVYDFTVQVASREWFEERTVQIEVGEVYADSHVLLCGASAIYPGNETTFCLEVTSQCNLATEFSFVVEGAPSDWDLVYEPANSTLLNPNQKQQFSVVIRPPKTTLSRNYELNLTLLYGGGSSFEVVPLYIIETPTDNVGPSDGDGKLVIASWMWILVAAVIVAVVLALLLMTRGRSSSDGELPFESDGSGRERPLPPPPPPMAAPVRRTPPPPPPPKPPETVDELLAGTEVMQRVSEQYDRYSADTAYASGQTLADSGDAAYAGDCPKCGGKVMEYASGALMCKQCGTQYTDD